MRRGLPSLEPIHASFAKCFQMVHMSSSLFMWMTSFSMGTMKPLSSNSRDKLSKRFDVEFLGQAYWYLSARIYQDADFNITLDQARYCQAIVNRFLEKAGTKKKPRFHSLSYLQNLSPVWRTVLRMKRQPKPYRRNMELTLPHVLEPCYTCHTLDQILPMLW